MKTAVERLTTAFSLVAIAYHFMTIWVIPHGATRHYSTHLGFILVIATLATATRVLSDGRGRLPLRLTFLALTGLSGVIAVTYQYVEDARLEVSQPWLTPPDFVIGVLTILSVLGMTYMIWGLALTLFGAVSIVYFFYGHLLSGVFWHVEMVPTVVMSYIAGMGAPRGVFWAVPLSAETVFLLLVFGGTLHGTRAIEMFIEIGKAVGNLLRGGIAYSAVVSSALIAMVTGEAISNVVLSGSMTIPAMKARGFKPEEAGAVEVVASSGSQITPPIMSVAAFLMAVILNVAYIEIVQRAVVPALIYYVLLALGIYLMILSAPHIRYERERVNVRLILWILPSFLISFVWLVVLLSYRFSPGYAAFWSTAVLVALSWLRPKGARPSLRSLIDGFQRGAVVAAQLAVVLAAIGIIIQTFLTTGLGIALGRIVTGVAAGELWRGLLIGAAIAIAIGTALPTPAAYSLIAIVVVPALINLGAAPISAHFFALYFAAFSTITPPVAVAVLAAIRISGGSFMGTAWESIKLSSVAFLLPFTFVLAPEILAFPKPTLKTLEVVAVVLLGGLCAGFATYGYLFRVRLAGWERWVLSAGPWSLLGYLASGRGWWIVLPVMALTMIGGRRLFGSAPGRLRAAKAVDPPNELSS